MRKKEIRFQFLCHCVMGAAAIVTVLPLILLFMSSITDNKDITLYGYSFFPKHFSIEAYSYIWNERAQIFRAYFITVLVTGVKWCGKTTSSKRHAASEIVLDSSEEGRDLILRAEAMPSDLLGKEPPSAYRRMAERP